MSQPLTNRLRQHARRSGVAVGATMLLSIAICVGVFTAIYAKLTPLTSDFVSLKPRSGMAPPAPGSHLAAAAVATPRPVPTQPLAAAPTAIPTPPAIPPAAAAEVFRADYRTNGGYRVNLRAGPSSDNPNTVVTTLPPSTPLQYLNQDDASGGTR